MASQSSGIDRSPQPHTGRIITLQAQPSMSAYVWELVAQLAAQKLTHHYPHDLLILFEKGCGRWGWWYPKGFQ